VRACKCGRIPLEPISLVARVRCDCGRSGPWARDGKALAAWDADREAVVKARAALEASLHLLQVLDEVDCPNSALKKIREAIALLGEDHE
jgi:hypothetical protein